QADASVTLAWDPSTDTNVVSYTVYYGTASGAYANSLSAGASTTATVTGLLAGTTYFFAATAVNAAGLESPFSNETSYSVPEAPVNHLTISAIAGQTVAQDSATAPIPFIIGDAEIAASSLAVSATSDNQ